MYVLYPYSQDRSSTTKEAILICYCLACSPPTENKTSMIASRSMYFNKFLLQLAKQNWLATYGHISLVIVVALSLIYDTTAHSATCPVIVKQLLQLSQMKSYKLFQNEIMLWWQIIWWCWRHSNRNLLKWWERISMSCSGYEGTLMFNVIWHWHIVTHSYHSHIMS